MADLDRPVFRWLRTGLAVLLAGVSLAYALLVLPPWRPVFIYDPWQGWEWMLALHEFRSLGLQHGRDIIYTYGALGFVDTRLYHPATFHLLIASWLVLAVSLWAGLWSFARLMGWWSWLGLLWTVALVTLASVHMWSPAIILCALALTIGLGPWSSRVPWLAWLVVPGLAIVGLIKFSYFVAVITVVALIAVDDVRQRRFPMRAAVFVLVVCAANMALGGQRLFMVWHYITQSLPIASGYSEAMSLAGPPEQVQLFLLSAGALALCIGLARTPIPRAVLLAAGVAALVGLSFKAAFVRQDHWHVMPPALDLTLIATLTGCALYRGTSRRGWAVGALACAAVAAAFYLASMTFPAVTGTSVVNRLERAVRQPHANGRAIRRLVFGRGEDDLRREYAASLDRQATLSPIPKTDGSVDVYPWESWIPIAHHLPFAPRPIFSSYAAYSRRLSELNRQHLEGPNAPKQVIFSLRPIDGRHPLLDDALSVPELLTRYTVEATQGGTVLLGRAAHPGRYETVPLSRWTRPVGTSFRLPAHDRPLLLSLQVTPSVTGYLNALFFRAPVLELHVRAVNGEERRYRFIRSMSAVPFVVSPVVDDAVSLASLGQGGFPRERAVSEVTLNIAGEGRSALKSTYDASVSTLRIVPPEIAR